MPSLEDKLAERLDRVLVSIDKRSLGLTRIVLGLVLLYDLGRWVGVVDYWLTINGLMPASLVLQRRDYDFSLLFWAVNPGEVYACFAVMAAIYLVFLFGYRTRVFHVLSLVCVISLHSRGAPVNGGDRTLNLITLWTLFLPMGDRFSIDALRKSLARRRETTIAELADRGALEPDQATFRSLAVLAIFVQLSLAYILNAVSKNSPQWRDFSYLYYVFHNQRQATRLACAVRDMPLVAYKVMTFMALAIEYTAAPLILSPFGVPWTRRVAIVAFLALHVGIVLVLNVGVFSWAMIVFEPLLLGPEDWAAFGRRATRRLRRRRVDVDGTSPLAFQLARLLARLDQYGALDIAVAPPRAEGKKRRVLASVDPETRAREVGPLALWDAARSLPLGRFWAWALRFGPLAYAVERAFADEAAVTKWFGLRAEGEPAVSVPDRVLPAILRKARDYAREATIAVFMIACTHRLLQENEPLAALRPPVNRTLIALTSYLKLKQGWHMFNGTGDRTKTIFVDALTVDGRHVDPYNLVASRHDWQGVPQKALPDCMSQDSMFESYSREFAEHGRGWRPFVDWVMRYPQRTHRADDQIVEFTLYEGRERLRPPEDERPGPAEYQLVPIFKFVADGEEMIDLRRKRGDAGRGGRPEPGAPAPESTPQPNEGFDD